MKSSAIHKFVSVVWSYYCNNRREMPWRHNTCGYYVFLSEVMLQQTQVDRVMAKFDEFISVFPDFRSLANAEFNDVLSLWSGLGYNRRARFLYDSAKRIWEEKNGIIPCDLQYLVSLPGIGQATASAILVYIFNKPHVFLETNVRTVYIHHFFRDVSGVSDKDIFAIAEKTVDQQNPREWFWALMDYGSFLKKKHGNLNKKSSSYVKQSKFEGSVRQKRGAILRFLLNGNKTLEQIVDEIKMENELAKEILNKLVLENLIVFKNNAYAIKTV